MSDPRRTTTVTATALGLALALSACGGQSPSSSASVTLVGWSKQDGPKSWATPATPPTGQNPERKSVVMPALSMQVESDGNVKSHNWPNAKDVLTADAMKGLFPDGKDFETKDCGAGTFEDASAQRAEQETHCTYAVSLPNDSGGKSTMKVSIRAVGADAPITQVFESDNSDILGGDKARDSATDRLWKNGTFGAKRLIKSGSDYKVVVSDGKVAMYYVLTFDGFNLFGQSMAAKQQGLEKNLLPFVIQDLAFRLPA